MTETEEIAIYKGSRGEDFKRMLVNVFRMGNLSPKYFNVLTSDNSIAQYNKVFTASSANDKDNYEVYEILGDSTANKCMVWYFHRRFPQLNCPEGVKVIARLKINYVGKREFALIAEKLDFWNYITASVEERISKKASLLEDVFEAFIGATEYLLDSYFQIGVGYAIVYDILQTIFDQKEISLKYENLYDAKTRLKEYFDMHRELGQLVYTSVRDEATNMFMASLATDKDRRTILGRGEAKNKGDAEQMAAQAAITRFNFVKDIPDFYKYFC